MTRDIRADLLIVEQNLLGSRAQAQRMIIDKRVYYKRGLHWRTIEKPSLKLPSTTQLKIEPNASARYVSRGGLKLAGALSSIALNVDGMIALDVGQSTGGFTDCLLQAGVAKVVGVDVGHGQLAPALRRHPRVISFEGINARRLPAARLLPHTQGGGFDLVVMDVSFISQTLILPSLVSLLKPGGRFIGLVKPQFEVGKGSVGKGGLVRDTRLYKAVEKKLSQCCRDAGLRVLDYRESAIAGGDGNREFTLYAQSL